MKMSRKNPLATGRFIYFAGPEKPRPGPETPPPGVGVTIDVNKPKEMTPEQKTEYIQLRADMASWLGRVPVTGSPENMKIQIQNALSRVPMSGDLKKTLFEHRRNAQHVYTFDKGNYFVEVELVPTSETQVETKITVYKKGEVPEGAHDVADTETLLSFRASAIQALRNLKTRREIILKGRELVAAMPQIKDAVAEGKARYPSNHIMSTKLQSGEPVDIWLFRQKDGRVEIGVLPYKVE